MNDQHSDQMMKLKKKPFNFMNARNCATTIVRNLSVLDHDDTHALLTTVHYSESHNFLTLMKFGPQEFR